MWIDTLLSNAVADDLTQSRQIGMVLVIILMPVFAGVGWLLYHKAGTYRVAVSYAMFILGIVLIAVFAYAMNFTDLAEQPENFGAWEVVVIGSLVFGIAFMASGAGMQYWIKQAEKKAAG